MDAKQLAYFTQVAQLRSYSRAGEALHITQPTLSKVIKNLEDELGTVLLERSTKHVALTDAGEVVLRHALTIAACFQDLHTELDDMASIRKGSVKVGLPPMVGSRFFPRILGGFRDVHPGVSISLLEYGALKVESEVESGALDLGVALLPVDSATFETYPFSGQELRAVLRPGHRLAGQPQVELAELEGEVFILYREDFTLHGRIREACAGVGYKPEVAFMSSQWDFISEMAAEGLGVALLPQAICAGLDAARVVSLPLVNPTIPWNLALIWRRGRYLSHAAKEFIRFTKAAMGE